MVRTLWRATILAGISTVWLTRPASVERAHAQDKTATQISAAEFEKLRKDLHVKNQPWATVPWKVSVTEARAVAAKEKKPIFLVVNTGNCLGFV